MIEGQLGLSRATPKTWKIINLKEICTEPIEIIYCCHEEMTMHNTLLWCQQTVHPCKWALVQIFIFLKRGFFWGKNETSTQNLLWHQVDGAILTSFGLLLGECLQYVSPQSVKKSTPSLSLSLTGLDRFNLIWEGIARSPICPVRKHPCYRFNLCKGLCLQDGKPQGSDPSNIKSMCDARHQVAQKIK